MNIPVIDLANPNQAEVLHQIDEACQHWGFFQIIGHGVDPKLIGDIISASRRFFELPRREKRTLSRDEANCWGYFDKELTKNALDWKEIYDFGPADGGALKPRWPKGAFRLEFEPTIRAYYATCMQLSLRLMANIAKNLGVHDNSLLENFEGAHTSFLRLNHYPRLPGQEGPMPLGVGEHTDSGALTVLLTDETPGLEVKKGGRWIAVEPVENAFVINIGDMVQVWSNDRYQAALHRVVANPQVDRFSVPFFLNPSYETVYGPLPTAVLTSAPARYRDIKWQEFRNMRAAGDYADLGEEVQISHYRI